MSCDLIWFGKMNLDLRIWFDLWFAHHWWLGTGSTESRGTKNKIVTKLCWPLRKRSPERLIVPAEPKPQQFSIGPKIISLRLLLQYARLYTGRWQEPIAHLTYKDVSVCKLSHRRTCLCATCHIISYVLSQPPWFQANVLTTRRVPVRVAHRHVLLCDNLHTETSL